MSLWDLKAEVYESARRLFPFNLILKQETDNIRTLINGAVLDSKPLLDVGTGTGEVLRLLPKHSQLFALDRSLKMLKRAAQKGQHHAVVADALAVPFKAGVFSVITAVGVFEYAPDHQLFLRELRRVLSPSGSLVLTYSRPGLLNLFRMVLGHRIYFTSKKDDLTEFLKRSGFVCKTHLRSRIQGQLLLKKK